MDSSRELASIYVIRFKIKILFGRAPTPAPKLAENFHALFNEQRDSVQRKLDNNDDSHACKFKIKKKTINFNPSIQIKFKFYHYLFCSEIFKTKPALSISARYFEKYF